MQKVTDSATELTGAKFGAFFYNVIDAAGESFLLYTLSGAPREAFERFGLPRNTPVFETTFRGVGIIRSADITKDPRYGQLPPHHGMPRGHLPVRSYLAVPVKSRSGEVIGGLFFGHPEPDVFTERAERLVGGMAAQAGIAIDNARLYDAAQKASEERRGLLESERAARSAAERLSEIKDEFLATLSHELRTPLNAIVGWAEVLRRGPKSEADLAKGLETIERSARVQAQLIDDLLDMSRIASGKMRLDVQPIRPSSFIQAAVETLKPSAEAKGVTLTTVLDPGAGPISGDPNRLQQVVWNLLSNAIKFTPRGGKVQILLERVNSHVEISVADTGIGIKPEFADHLFERFRQADATASRNYGGLGLGLSIVKQLVELHGGTIHVASPGEDLGTTVVVRLPLTVVHRAGSEAGRPEEPSAAAYLSTDLSGVKVLVVDDQEDACELIRRLLEDCGAVVTTSCSAEEALPLVSGERPDVLISDIGMPGTDGYRFLASVRDARSGERRPRAGDRPHGLRPLGRSHARPARRIPRARLETRGPFGARGHRRERRGPDSRAAVDVSPRRRLIFLRCTRRNVSCIARRRPVCEQRGRFDQFKQEVRVMDERRRFGLRGEEDEERFGRYEEGFESGGAGRYAQSNEWGRGFRGQNPRGSAPYGPGPLGAGIVWAGIFGQGSYGRGQGSFGQGGRESRNDYERGHEGRSFDRSFEEDGWRPGERSSFGSGSSRYEGGRSSSPSWRDRSGQQEWSESEGYRGEPRMRQFQRGSFSGQGSQGGFSGGTRPHSLGRRRPGRGRGLRATALLGQLRARPWRPARGVVRLDDGPLLRKGAQGLHPFR